jgi:menaquinol-cytochrome c reductase iron-sulfur subunit
MEKEHQSPPALEEIRPRTRRDVLKAGVGVLTALITIVLGIPFVASVLGRSGRRTAGRFDKVTDLASLPIGEPVNLRYSETAPEAFIRMARERDVWAVRTSASQVTVFSPICPHLGCRYNWNPAASEFMCPCHGSVFGVDGSVRGGPSPRPLDTLPVKIVDGVVYVRWEVFMVGTARKVAI